MNIAMGRTLPITLLISTIIANTNQYLIDTHDLNHMSTERNAILNAHNRMRRATYASDMQELVWDPKLADTARSWAANCDTSHSPRHYRRGSGDWSWVGENLWWHSGGVPDLNTVTQDWYDEIYDYDYGSGYCSGVCGHYTQIVWAETCSLGCAISQCSNFVNGLGVPGGYYVVCNYGPGGNIRGIKPYKTGSACSDCPSGCSNGKCEPTCSRLTPFANALVRHSTASTVKTACTDTTPLCSDWAKFGHCESNAVYMKKHCAKSCRAGCAKHAQSNKQVSTLPTRNMQVPPKIDTTVLKRTLHEKERRILSKVKPKPGACVDSTPHCADWSLNGHCEVNPQYMGKACPRSCRRCVAVALSDDYSCKDLSQYCKKWATRTDRCQTNKSFMEAYCAESCNLCRNSQLATS